MPSIKFLCSGLDLIKVVKFLCFCLVGILIFFFPFSCKVCKAYTVLVPSLPLSTTFI